jgi:DNA-binding transcriptional LysR family regulator
MDISLAKIDQLLAIARMLSKSVALLEQRYGMIFFERGRSGAVLTRSGAQFIEEMEGLLRSARTLDHNLRQQARGETGSVELGIGPTVASMILSEIGAQLFSSRRKIRLQTLIRPTEVLLGALLEDKIDLFVSPKVPDMPSAIDYVEAGKMMAVFVVRSDHPLAARSPVKLSDVLEFPLAGPAQIPWANSDEGTPKGSFICENLQITMDVVFRSDLVWITDPGLIERELKAGRLKKLEVPNSPLTEVGSDFAESKVIVGWLKGRTLTPLAEQIVTLCQTCLSRSSLDT